MSNAEFWQVIRMNQDSYERSTPKALLYPAMHDPNEEVNWIKDFSGIVKAIHLIFYQKLIVFVKQCEWSAEKNDSSTTEFKELTNNRRFE